MLIARVLKRFVFVVLWCFASLLADATSEIYCLRRCKGFNENLKVFSATMYRENIWLFDKFALLSSIMIRAANI